MGARAVNDAIEDLLHHATTLKKKVTAVFYLVNGQIIDEASPFLISNV